MENSNDKKIWFRAKNYGWGWYPVSWQGWLVMLVWIAFLVKIFIKADLASHSGSDTLINFAIPFIVSTIIFLAICYKKGEKPEWRWGK